MPNSGKRKGRRGGKGKNRREEDTGSEQQQSEPQHNPPPSCSPTQEVDNAERNDDVVQRISDTPAASPSATTSDFLHPTVFDSALKLEPFPKKPNPGSSGRKIQLISNLFPINIPSGYVYHYDVDIKNVRISSKEEKLPPPAIKELAIGKEFKLPEKKQTANKNGATEPRSCTNKTANRKTIHTLFSTYVKVQKFYPAYDGKKNLITRKPLPIAPLHLMVFTDDGNFDVTIKEVIKNGTHTCAISFDQLHELLAGRTTHIPTDAIMALEIVLRHGPALRYLSLGRSFFSPPERLHSLGGGKEIWFGHHQSVRIGQWKPMVNIDTTATAVYERKNLIDVICDEMKMTSEMIQSVRNLYGKQIENLTKRLKNLRVETTHLGYTRKYRVKELTAEPANRVTFEMEDKNRKWDISVSDYFQRQYNIHLRFPNLPCLQVGSGGKKVHLPLEVCYLVGGQHCNTRLSAEQTSRMIKQTAIPPRERFDMVRKIRAETFNNNPWIKEFELKINTEPERMPGRVIDSPNARYRNQTVKPKDGAWNMVDKKFFSGAEVKEWVLVSFEDMRFCKERDLKRFADMIYKIGSQLGMTLRTVRFIKTCNFNDDIKSVLREMKEVYKAQLVVVILPSRNISSVYSEVKRASEIEIGLITQCFKSDNVVNNCKHQVIANLCQKLNAKMGGVNNTLQVQDIPKILRNKIIVIGADVSHPAKGDEIKLSIAAVVGSMDGHHCRYAATVGVQKNKEESKKNVIEIIIELKKMVKEILLEYYRRNNGLKPEKIIFYRDGVSEGQFAQVQNHEVRQVRDACYEMSHNSDYQPEITFIIVQKRHHVRFHPTNDHEGVGRGKNAPPGTVVDTTITHPLYFDFFLCSHASPQGTARPANYTVVWDDYGFSADDLQKLSYYLCHVFTRCTRSVSNPVPVMYAHLVAYRARQHLVTQHAGTVPLCATDPVPPETINAVKVLPELKNVMYFV